MMSVKKVFDDTLKFTTDIEIRNALSYIFLLQDYYDIFFRRAIADLYIPT